MSPFFIAQNYHYWVLLNQGFSLRCPDRAARHYRSGHAVNTSV